MDLLRQEVGAVGVHKCWYAFD